MRNSPDNIRLGTLDASYYASLWHYNGEKWDLVLLSPKGFAASALYLNEDNLLWVSTPQDYIFKWGNGEWTE